MNTKECGVGYFECIDSRILIFTVTNGEPSKEEIEEYKVCYLKELDRMNDHFVTVFDTSKGKWLSPSERKELSAFTKKVEDLYKERFRKAYMVIPNPVMNIALKGVNLLSKPQIPQEIFTNRADAIAAAKAGIARW